MVWSLGICSAFPNIPHEAVICPSLCAYTTDTSIGWTKALIIIDDPVLLKRTRGPLSIPE
jgi:hypothetical protein